MKTSLYTKAGVNVISGIDAYEQMNLLLDMVEHQLNGAGVHIEFVDVEPSDDHGIRFSISLDGKEL